jgi:MerR family redox-sensitive transcriptional activator SoxR
MGATLEPQVPFKSTGIVEGIPALDTEITIGDLARRSGVATSALRFYESRGLISSARTNGGQRRFPRPMLRRVAFIQAAQRVGLSLDEIATALHTLPERRTPTKADWAVLSRSWTGLLQSRIEELETLQTRLTSCIGCGCLSLKSCGLLNPGDRAAARGSGARYLLGDSPEDEH